MSTHDSIRNAKQPDEMQYRQVRSQHKEKSSEQTEVWLKSGSTIAEADLGIKVGPTKGMEKFCH